MKTFKQFISEASRGRAAEQATRSGLVSDGHGGWLNRQGLMVAKTEKDRLIFIKPETPKKAEPAPPPIAPAASQPLPAQKPKAVAEVPLPKFRKKKQEDEPVPKIKKTKSITVVFGKFNPPTVGHLKLIKKAKQVSGTSELRIYPSRIQNDQNPLDPKNKVRYMRLAYPEFADEIMNNQSMKTIFDVLAQLDEDGFKSVQIVVGSQRESEIDRLANQYNGKLYEFETIDVIPANAKDPDSDSSDAQSSSSLRKAAINNDYFKFKVGLPPNMDEKEKKNLFYAVKRFYDKSSSLKEMWKIFPDAEYKSLRENYYRGDIFRVGDLVENQVTGVVGRIKRRGPNYVICVNEELGLMFKPWIQDIVKLNNVKQ